MVFKLTSRNKPTARWQKIKTKRQQIVYGAHNKFEVVIKLLQEGLVQYISDK